MFEDVDDGDLRRRVDFRQTLSIRGICGLVEIGPAGQCCAGIRASGGAELMLFDAAHDGDGGAGLVHEGAEAVDVGDRDSGVVEEVGDWGGVFGVVEDEDQCYVAVCAGELGNGAESADVRVVQCGELVAGERLACLRLGDSCPRLDVLDRICSCRIVVAEGVICEGDWQLLVVPRVDIASVEELQVLIDSLSILEPLLVALRDQRGTRRYSVVGQAILVLLSLIHI